MNDGQQAHDVVARAIKTGLLPPLDGITPCVDCGSPASDYEHRDYKNPLAVQATCRSCNKLRGSAIGWVPIKLKSNGTPMNDARKRLGLSIDDLVRRSDVTYWQAVRALRGQTQKLSVMKKICRALGLNIADVIGR